MRRCKRINNNLILLDFVPTDCIYFKHFNGGKKLPFNKPEMKFSRLFSKRPLGLF